MAPCQVICHMRNVVSTAQGEAFHRVCAFEADILFCLKQSDEDLYFAAKLLMERVAFLSTILHLHPHKMWITRRRGKNAAL
jgi:hypothetical protein